MDIATVTEPLSRRQSMHTLARLLLPALALTGTGCHTRSARTDGSVAPDLGPGERLLDLRTGRDATPAALLAELRQARTVLLGERHDNPWHHERRGALLQALGDRRASVVAEHLTRGRTASPQGDLLEALQSAGFDSAGWRWPLHAPLFEAIRAAGLPLHGANLPREAVRQIARGGTIDTLPAVLGRRLTAHPLSTIAEATLDRALVEGHCGQLPPARLPAMRLAQRARDAAMAEALHALTGSGDRPVVLLAGNGHVRADTGVPTLLDPSDGPVVSVLFEEWPSGAPAPTPDLTPGGASAATHVWFTPAAARADPCAVPLFKPRQP